MLVSLKAIKRMIETGCAQDITNADNITDRPINSTIVFHSVGRYGLNGIILRDNATGQLYAVAGRVTNLFILAY